MARFVVTLLSVLLTTLAFAAVEDVAVVDVTRVAEFEPYVLRMIHADEDRSKLGRALQLPLHSPESEEERLVLEAIGRAFAKFFRGDLGRLEGVATAEVSGEDVMVARFENVIVYDDPIHVAFYFHDGPGVWASTDATRRFFERRVRREKPATDDSARGRLRPPPLTGVGLIIGPIIGFGGFNGGFAHVQVPTIEQNWISLWKDESRSWAAFTIKHGDAGFLSASELDELTWIVERFPRLSARVGQWSKARLMAEVGQRGERWTKPHPVIGTRHRDRILVRELLKRDLTDRDVSALLAMPSPAEGRTILEVIQAAGQTARFEAPIRDYLSYLFRNPEIHYLSNGWSPAVSVALAVVLRDDGIDLVDLLMAQPRGEYGGLIKDYLSKRVTRMQDYRQLRERFPGEEDDEWLNRIGARLGLPRTR